MYLSSLKLNNQNLYLILKKFKQKERTIVVPEITSPATTTNSIVMDESNLKSNFESSDSPPSFQVATTFTSKDQTVNMSGFHVVTENEIAPPAYTTALSLGEKINVSTTK